MLLYAFLAFLAIAGLISQQLFARQVGVEFGSRTVSSNGAVEYDINLRRAMDGLTIDRVGRDCPRCTDNIVITSPPKRGRVELVPAEQPAINGGGAEKTTDLMYTGRSAGAEPDEFTYRVYTSSTEFREKRVVVKVK